VDDVLGETTGGTLCLRPRDTRATRVLRGAERMMGE
jgi:hypothetical protein